MGAPLRWLKTAHVFPNVAALQAERRRLGKLLVEEHGLPPQDLEEALALQQELGRPLGEILGAMGLARIGPGPGAAQVHEQAADEDGLRPAERALADLPSPRPSGWAWCRWPATVRPPSPGGAADHWTARPCGCWSSATAVRWRSSRLPQAPCGRRAAGLPQAAGGRPAAPAQRRSLTPDEVDTRAIDRLGRDSVRCTAWSDWRQAPGCGHRRRPSGSPGRGAAAAVRLGESAQVERLRRWTWTWRCPCASAARTGRARARCAPWACWRRETERNAGRPAAVSAWARLLGGRGRRERSPLNRCAPPEPSGVHPITGRGLDHAAAGAGHAAPESRPAGRGALYPGRAIAWEVSPPEPLAVRT